MEKKKLKFTLTPSKYGNSYFAHVRHTQVVSVEEVVKGISEMLGGTKAQELNVRHFMDAMAVYIDRELRKGNQVTVGGFRVGLSIEGTFDSANASFDPEKHRLKVVAMPRKVLQRATENLEPVNETVDEVPRLESVWGASHTSNVLESGGTCEANGDNLLGGPDTGIDRIWLETANGEIVAEGAVTFCDWTRLSFTIPSGIAPGEYVLVAERPNADGRTRSRARRKVSVV